MPHRSTGLGLVVMLAGLVAGCGSKGGAPSLVCDPACPPGTRCTVEGCVADAPPPDFAIAPGDIAGGCSPACAGATPFCTADGRCVACLTDDHCPAGSVCIHAGATSVCAPGCTDDARCQTGGATSMRCCQGRCADVSTDAQNCGACGTACSALHAAAMCVDAACASGSCAAGWADCNRDGADGCETNLRTDSNSCGACGTACALKNAFSGCAGSCYVAGCAFGFDDCNGVALDGCEVSVVADAKNCGACGNTCKAPPHASVACLSASCQLVSCQMGFADCNGNAGDGCEVSTNSDSKNCGACGFACGQGQVCIGAQCTCPPCNFPNAMSACMNNQCVLGACNFGFGDCDNQVNNGCELPVLSDAKNCGRCGNVCAQGLICKDGGCTCPNCVLAHARTACVNNVCTLDSCLPGFGNCDANDMNGCEADVSMDKNNCGACGKVCPMNLPFCIGSQCSAGCLMGKVPPNVCDAGADRAGTPFVVCQADCKTAWISHSMGGGGKFHPLEICNNFGYSNWSGWAGTFGSVCGTNNGNTSCMAPGQPNFANSINAPNMGVDQFGPVIGNTVEWQCVQ